MRIPAGTAVLSLLLLPAAVSAQRQSCELFPMNATRATVYPEQGLQFIGGGARFVCAGGLTVTSDSVARVEAAGVIEFIGNVHYADSVKTLTSDYAQYIGAAREMNARGNVVLTDRENGSQILAPYLQYFQESATRSESLVMIYSGRPRAILIRQHEAAPADTTIIDSDAMQIEGERRFIGRGNVAISRGTMRAFGNEGHFDQEADSMRLVGGARILSDDYVLHGDTITATVTPDNEFREVMAWRQASLESEDLRAEAPRLRIVFEQGEVHRLVAVGGAATAPSDPSQPTPPPVPEGAAGTGPQQAVTSSNEFRLVADSIDALAPNQQLESVVAVGSAFGERLLPDTLVARRPPQAQSDWMRGDTILATFVASPEPASDTTARNRQLETITAVAGAAQAQSLYGLPDENDPDGRLAYSYILAQRIAVALKDGEVSSVRAVGRDGAPVHGIYLQPSDSTRAAPARAGAGRARGR